jgi:hypothetical protein
MAYMNQEKKARIAAKLKPILKKYAVKGSLSVRNHSTILLTVKSGQIDFHSDYGRMPGDMGAYADRNTDIQVNPYWFHEHFEGASKEFLAEVFPVLKSADWYDESDAQTDYFNTAYYVAVNIGKWDKPYTLEK